MTIPISGTPVPRTTQRLAESGAGARLRLGFITHLDQHEDVATIYRDNIRLIQALEDLGYDSAWIATRHFHSGWAALPTPFAFLGAAAVATSRIHLGTAVLPLLVDDPVRDAEEAAVLDAISGGRLQLGLGKGVPSDAYHVFSRWGGERESEFDSKTDQLRWALQGSQIPGSAASVWPAASDLLGRLYQGTSNRDTIRRAARNGDGLILERFGNSPEERNADGRPGFLRRQTDQVVEYRRAFREAWGDSRTPYVVTSRTGWPGPLEEAAHVTSRWAEFGKRFGRVPEGLDAAGELLSDNIVWGDPELLAQRLLEDPTIVLTDELVLGVHPAQLTIDETIERARVLIEEVAPIITAAWTAQRPELDDIVDAWQGIDADAEAVRS